MNEDGKKSHHFFYIIRSPDVVVQTVWPEIIMMIVRSKQTLEISVCYKLYLWLQEIEKAINVFCVKKYVQHFVSCLVTISQFCLAKKVTWRAVGNIHCVCMYYPGWL